MHMEQNLQFGDLVVSTAGRDKGKYLIVISVQGKTAKVVDGKTRKIFAPKQKNIKHLKTVESATMKSLAEKIQKGVSVGNKVVYRRIKTQTQKIQED